MLQTELQELNFDWAIRILKHQIRIKIRSDFENKALMCHWKRDACIKFLSMENFGIERKLNLSKVRSYQIRFSFWVRFFLEFSVEASPLTNHKNQSRFEFSHQTKSSFRECFHVRLTQITFLKSAWTRSTSRTLPLDSHKTDESAYSMLHTASYTLHFIWPIWMIV